MGKFVKPVLLMLTFCVLCLALGITLIHFTIQIQNELKDACVNEYINISLNIILLLGLLLSCISITSCICLLTCDCYSLNLTPLSFILVIIFLILIICGSIIWHLVTGDNIITDCYTDNIKSYAIYITSFSGALCALSIVGSYFSYKKKNQLKYENAPIVPKTKTLPKKPLPKQQSSPNLPNSMPNSMPNSYLDFVSVSSNSSNSSNSPSSSSSSSSSYSSNSNPEKYQDLSHTYYDSGFRTSRLNPKSENN